MDNVMMIRAAAGVVFIVLLGLMIQRRRTRIDRKSTRLNSSHG